jgi:hypothetical protein
MNSLVVKNFGTRFFPCEKLCSSLGWITFASLPQAVFWLVQETLRPAYDSTGPVNLLRKQLLNLRRLCPLSSSITEGSGYNSSISTVTLGSYSVVGGSVMHHRGLCSLLPTVQCNETWEWSGEVKTVPRPARLRWSESGPATGPPAECRRADRVWVLHKQSDFCIELLLF